MNLAFFRAAESGDTDTVLQWIQNGADINQLMIDAGADPAITNRYGGTALIPASEHGYIDAGA
ncbi:hypothetical protein GCM10008018_64030 [Paenibacillus marchantiophytorum]|uniref:Ankyrin repeat domain-containing protein n=1 Tax=Paenibacillus marchantiophytorum TaxID=1619310 RepID=A0ABQ1FF35_9BACL|nr:hypothetical protein GCM10008018_64030 [Paenibacillus marchantiophytorum]